MKKAKWVLWTFEASAVLVFVGLLLLSGQKKQGSPALEPIDPAAFELGIDAKEWFGVYFLDQKVGYAVSSRKRMRNGGEFVHTEAAYTMAAAGQIARSVMASTAVLDPDKRLSQFDFFLSAHPVRLAARGLFQDGVLAIDVYQGGEHQRIELPMEESPHVGASLPAWIGEQELIQEGDVFTLPYFDPVSLSQKDMEIRVLGTEVLASGEEAYWLERDFGGATTKSLVLPNGETLREESAMGLSMRRESADEARSMPAADEVVDVIALSAVNLNRSLSNFRDLRTIRLKVKGVEAESLAHDPPLQEIDSGHVEVRIPERSEMLPSALSTDEQSLLPFMETGPFLMADHAEIQSKSREILEGVSDRVQAVERLNQWVFEYLRKIPTVGVPNALEVLRVGQGDCNEHTALFVGLARAARIPSRVAAGVVYSDRVSEEAAFFYHAWPEVYFEGAGWVPVDPTFGQFPADATHIKVVDGGLDKQIAIMGVMGRLGFEWAPE